MTLKRGKIRKALLRKGFVEERKTKHIAYRFYYRNARTDLATLVSRGSNSVELSRTLLSQMARQCGVSNEHFRGLIDCSLSEAEYIQLVGHLLPK